MKAGSCRSTRTEYLAPPVVQKLNSRKRGRNAFMFCLTNLVFIQLPFHKQLELRGRKEDKKKERR